jgi:intracellular sulfur oxidation DsrE/DsrF family protein
MQSAPFGVVFEIVERDKDALDWAMPEVKKYAAIIRERFPELGIAVVTHGKEQFALMKSNGEKKQKVQQLVKSLVQDQDIPVHICGTHASWYDKSAKDFPDYVDVAPAGPTQINNYTDMGYELIVLDKP